MYKPTKSNTLKNIFLRFYEKYAPKAVLDPNAPDHWREKVQYMFVLICVFVGFIVMIAGIPGNIENEYWIIQGSVIIAYLSCLLVFLFPTIRYKVRAVIVCGFVYLIGVSILLTVGPFLASREWLFAFTIIASVLLAWPGAIGSIIINLITWISVGVLIHAGYWDNLFKLENALLYWFMISIDLLFINISTVVLITLLFLRINQSDRSTKSYSQLLLYERNKLTESNKSLALEIEDRKKITRALRESEEKYRSILETIDDSYFEFDLEGNLQFSNQAMCLQLGYSKKELSQMNYKDYTDKSHAEKLDKLFKTVLDTRKANVPAAIEVITRDNSIRTLSIVVSLIYDNENEPCGFRGIGRDITEYRHMEDSLRRAQKMEALGTLAGGVAHDLNNTLTGVVSYPELILLQMSESDPMREPIMSIKKSGEKAVAIIQDLLTLAIRGVAVKKITNINTLIMEYFESPEFKNLQKFHPGVEINTQLDQNLLNISGSPIHLSKTIMNLVSNAAEAIKENGTIHITTENRYIESGAVLHDGMHEGDHIVITISDTGGGIAPSDLDKIFEPFFTKKVMGRSGTGLGMAVVWGTVKDHNGYIDVKSAIGQGTIFTVYLPATRKAIVTDDSSISIDNYKGNGESILIVDDIESQRDITTDMLIMLGYSPISVKSGEEALEYLKTNSVELIILDMIMHPGIDGLDTYKKIIEFQPGQKAIIASGYSETRRVKEAYNLGAGSYLKKPYSIEILGKTIKKELLKN